MNETKHKDTLQKMVIILT